MARLSPAPLSGFPLSKYNFISLWCLPIFTCKPLKTKNKPKCLEIRIIKECQSGEGSAHIVVTYSYVKKLVSTSGEQHAPGLALALTHLMAHFGPPFA